jgi:hypothetical protein
MVIFSNTDFCYLVKEQSPRLKAFAKKLSDKDPNGDFTTVELDRVIDICAYSGDNKSTKWLKNLKSLVASGSIEDIYRGRNVFDSHIIDVHRRCKKGDLPFDINDRVTIHSSGKVGMVADFNDDTNKYILVLDPFQMVEFSKDELSKIASKQ